MGAEFYRAFEEKYRGSRELIRWRLRSYLPFIEPLPTLCPGAPAIDLGCGRGEWLELLGEVGIEAQGIDLDDAMLASCRKRGLRVTTQDAIAALRELPDASQALVTGFHLVEHLPFEALSDLVREAHRVLQAGGLLILETPNPENIAVATNHFYLDPTHVRPIPPPLLAFIPGYYGFATVKIVRLQEDPSLLVSSGVTLAEVLQGVSPDYAVIAQKAAAPEAQPVAAFESELGLTLEVLLARYQQAVDQRDKRLDELEKAASEAASEAALRADSMDIRLADLDAAFQRVTADLEAIRGSLEAIYDSRSWRLTRPLRWAGDVLRRLWKGSSTQQ